MLCRPVVAGLFPYRVFQPPTEMEKIISATGFGLWMPSPAAGGPRRTQKWRPHNKMWAKHVSPCRTKVRPAHTRPRTKRHVKKWEDQENYRNHKSRKETKSNTSRKTHTSYKNKKLKATSLAKTTKAGTEMLQSFKARKTKATQAIKSHRGFKTWSERKPHKLQKLQKQRKTLRDTQIQAWKNMPET